MNAIAPLGHNRPPSELEIVAERLLDHEKALRAALAKLMEAPAVITDEQHAGQVTDAIKAIAGYTRKVADIHKTVKEPYLECGRSVDSWKKRLECELDAVRRKFSGPLTDFLDRKARQERARQLEQARIERERAEALAAEAAAHEKEGLTETAQELMESAVNTEIMADRMLMQTATATPSQLARARSFAGGATASQGLVWTGEIENISAIDLNALRSCFTLDAIQMAINKFVRNGGRQLDGVLIEQKARLSVR